MTPRTKEQNEQIRSRRMAQILKAAADVYLDKGMLMEIRDVAAEAGLGYGTVYHYYKNKTDLLYDMLSQAMERAAELLRLPAAVASADLRTLAGRLLSAWDGDHAFYLACQLGGTEFRPLPEEQAVRLNAAYRAQVLFPLAGLLGPPGGSFAAAQAVSGTLSGAPPGPEAERRAEWLLAALAGCALPALRRGTLHTEAKQITQFLF
ncbi:TetR/AcrR family transcriptional regulator [Paenibacillus sp. M1]|uniref:TetR/AcrR family transcriptional regulator n=1 Tax=Paenibacillus haidiansis TaxID=1574488 RepID=A0ABU7VMR8_9BACL